MRVRRVAAAICGVFMLVVTTAVMAVPHGRATSVLILAIRGQNQYRGSATMLVLQSLR
ncbi:MAG: hypothetical protein GY782_04275 [Gammaproteobacteria bacterium]|nr:hypothetical protein [Gammaproteobacteria bacterium]